MGIFYGRYDLRDATLKATRVYQRKTLYLFVSCINRRVAALEPFATVISFRITPLSFFTYHPHPTPTNHQANFYFSAYLINFPGLFGCKTSLEITLRCVERLGFRTEVHPFPEYQSFKGSSDVAETW